jgi:hypothetical protein
LNHKRCLSHGLGLWLITLFLITSCAPLYTPSATPTVIPTLPTTETESLRVLFLGNSLTFFNDMPEMFAQLASSGGHVVEVDMSAQGGLTCADHATHELTLSKIAQQAWDFVVVQEQSQIPAIAEERMERMYPAIRLLNARISQNGASTILFMTWGHRNGIPDAGLQDFAAVQTQTALGYMEIANELGVRVAPVGLAWQHAISQDAQLGLWRADGIHPSEEGSYLAACVFYAVIYQQSSEGLTYRAGLSGETAQFLQTIAATIVLENPASWNIP